MPVNEIPKGAPAVGSVWRFTIHEHEETWTIMSVHPNLLYYDSSVDPGNEAEWYWDDWRQMIVDGELEKISEPK